MNDTPGPQWPTLFDMHDPPSSSGSKSGPETVSRGSAARTRTCKRCKTAKDSAEFYRNSKGYIRPTCKACDKERSAASRLKTGTAALSSQFRAWRQQRRGYALCSVAKNRAKRAGLEFSLDKDKIQATIDRGTCQRTGIAFDLDGGRTWNSPSLDRVDSNRGYTEDNVLVVIWALNAMNNVWGEDVVAHVATRLLAQRETRQEAFQRRLEEAYIKRTEGMHSPLFALTWTRAVTPSGRLFLRQQASALRTSDSDSTSWPTPVRQDAVSARRKGLAPGSNDGTTLLDAALEAAWPTPCARDPKGCGKDGFDALNRQGSESLPAVAAKAAPWATPSAQTFGENVELELERRAEMAKKHGNNGAGQTVALQAGLARSGVIRTGSSVTTRPVPDGARLNPALSRWLMGLPWAWDECAPSKRSRSQNGSPATPSD